MNHTVRIINFDSATHFNDVIRNQAAMNGYPMMKQVDSENPRQVRTLKNLKTGSQSNA